MSCRSRGLSDRNRADSPCGSTTHRGKWSKGIPSTAPAMAAASDLEAGVTGDGLPVGLAPYDADGGVAPAVGVEGEADPGLGRAAGDHVPHPVLVRVPGNAAVEGEAHGVDDRALARPGRADEGDVVDVGEVDDRGVSEGAEAGHLQPDRSHRPAPAAAGAEGSSSGPADSSSSSRAKRASRRWSTTFWPARYSANSSWGVRPARRDASAAASSV